MEIVKDMVSEKPLVIFSKSSCCISHSIKKLFSGFGVNATVYELDEISNGEEIEEELSRLGCSPSVPTIYIGGELIGGSKKVMTLHLSRKLKSMLKDVGALWV